MVFELINEESFASLVRPRRFFPDGWAYWATFQQSFHEFGINCESLNNESYNIDAAHRG